MSYFIFFFYDSATPAILTYRHTLSLHDAPPILLTQDAMADPFGAGNKTTEQRAAGMKRAVIVDLGAEEDFGGITARILELGQAEDPALARRFVDRKTSRLNSSH